MRRVEANGEWSLFCPNEAPGLADCWGEEFDTLFQKYEREGRAKRVIKAQQLWFAILEAQVSCHCSCVVCPCGLSVCLPYLSQHCCCRPDLLHFSQLCHCKTYSVTSVNVGQAVRQLMKVLAITCLHLMCFRQFARARLRNVYHKCQVIIKTTFLLSICTKTR